MIGIAHIGVYLPRLRLQRSAVAAAHAWAMPALKNKAIGNFATSNWDEDAVTMAHEASREVAHASSLDSLNFCSTTMPFADRSHATLLSEALGLPSNLRVQDVASSQRAALSTLLAALHGQRAGELIVAAERRTARPGSAQEIAYGDAAVAVVTGSSDLLAEFIAGASVNADFVDHYRSSGEQFDYAFEERWIRDEGFLKLVPEAISGVLTQAGVDAANIDRLIINAPSRVAASIAKVSGLDNAETTSSVENHIGEAGCAATLLKLGEALETMREGQLLLLVGFGQGADALLMRAGSRAGTAGAYSKALAQGVTDDNYLRFLSNRELISMDWGMRSERDVRTAQSSYYRERQQITAMIGGQCPVCDTVQFPKTKACVNPDCREFTEQNDYSFAGRRGRVKSFTEDWQAFSPAPPLTYGNIEFEGGANIFMQFTDTVVGQTRVGDEVTMHLRIKDFDRQRNFRRYFWKAITEGEH